MLCKKCKFCLSIIPFISIVVRSKNNRYNINIIHSKQRSSANTLVLYSGTEKRNLPQPTKLGHMLDPLQRDVAPLCGQVVVSDRADLAVRADEVLGVGDRVREGNVLEGEHVRHHPEAR